MHRSRQGIPSLCLSNVYRLNIGIGNRLTHDSSYSLHVASTDKDQIIRLRSSQSVIRYKTVESPPLSKSSVRSDLPQPPSAPPLQQVAPSPLNVSVTNLPTQEPAGHPPLQRTRISRNRHRYSFKCRKGVTVPPPPEKMKKYVFKPYKENMNPSGEPSVPDETAPKVKTKPVPKTLASRSSSKSRKLAIKRQLAYHHPVSSLDVGTLQANVRRISADSPILQSQIVRCVQDAVRDAASVKRRGQRIIGRFIEHASLMGPQLDGNDRVFLDLLCPRVTKKDVKDHKAGTDDREDDSDDDLVDLNSTSAATKNHHHSFLLSFLSHLYSGNYPQARGMGQTVDNFIKRLGELGIYTPPRPRWEINRSTPFTPTDLLGSVTDQLRVELKKMYKNGSCDLHQQLAERKKKGHLGTTVDIEIHEDRSAVENYLALNKLSRNPRRIVPLTTSKQPFVTFSERELVGFLFSRGGVLRARIQELARGAGTTLQGAQEWISGKEPGFLIKNFLVDIAPSNLTVRQRGKVGHRAAIELPTFDELETHVRMLDDRDFLPDTYTRKGYFPQGMVRTNGFNMQVLCFKARELLSVKYRRLPDDRLPPRLTSTVHGTGGFLTEVRNVIRTKEDVAKLWPNVDPRDIKTLTLDAGQAFVVGAYAHIPESHQDTDTAQSPPSSTAATQEPKREHQNKQHRNLAVNQKSVLQPMFRHRRWLEDEKQKRPEGPERQDVLEPNIELQSIAEIESQLPPLRGPGTSILDYVARLEEVEDRLLDFYAGEDNRFVKHSWDMQRAKHKEYQAIANSLLGIVGGSVGEHCRKDNPVLIGIGLGDFKSSNRMRGLLVTWLSAFKNSILQRSAPNVKDFWLR
ncbi:hypothetical protein BGZ70_004356 [Mortierella alpina]|uniref:Uncharacterized protein n=1 Tax=Mortierella alpina TaxID=64518 RepID=A0A9P6IQY6_MORAP|nr:hypothetical protein BGZ70_004356 [Mortierella alpina]